MSIGIIFMHIRRSAGPARSSRLLLFLLACLLPALLALPSPARAQQIDSTLVGRFQLADAFLRAGQFDRAITLLEDLHAEDPHAFVFFDKLKQAYESVKRYDDAIALVDTQLRRSRNASMLAEKGRLLYLKGTEAEADAAWEAAVQLAPEDPNSYRIVYQSLVDVRLFDRAIAVLEAGRQAMGTPEAFQSDLAYLYSLTGRHAEAMEEYLQMLAAHENQAAVVRSRLSRFTDQEEALRQSIAVTARAVRETPLNRAYREILGWLYVEDGQYREALDAYRAIDRLEQTQGAVLMQFAQIAADAAAYDVALEAYEEIRSRYPEAPVAPQALAGVGEMHEQWARRSGERAVDAQGDRQAAPHYEQARDTYRAFMQQYPQHPFYPEILRRLGRLEQDVFLNLGAAESTLEEVLTRYPNTEAAREAEYDLGRAAVLRGDLAAARLRFARLEEALHSGELAEQARYELALIHFYDGAFDAAQTLVSAIDANTSTDVANDAIALKVLLQENRGPDSLHTPLRMYAHARLLARQHRSVVALDTLEALIAAHGNHRLTDDARFMRASLLRETGRTEAALAAFSEFPLLHANSFLADRSLFAAAEIQEQELNDKPAALKLYARLLNEYPGSLLASETRERIRRLRGDGA